MAANRRGSTKALNPGYTAEQMGIKNDEEFVALWANVGGVLANVAGTNTITATAIVTIASYTDGLEFMLVPANANTGAVTVNIDGVGAVALRDSSGNALAANALIAGKALSIRYYAANGHFRIVSGSGGQVAYESNAAIFALTQVNATDGGTATSGAYRTYPLNTTILNSLVGEGAGLNTANNRVTLPAGTYDVIASAGFYLTGKSRLKLQCITDGIEIVTGQVTPQADSGSGNYVVNATLNGRFTIASAKVFELQYRVQTTNSGDGLGLAASFGATETEKYGFIAFRRVPGVVDPGAGWGRKTQWIPAGSHMIPNTTNGPASGTVETTTNKVMLKTLDYDASTAETAQYLWEPPKSWDRGTLAARFIWKHAATATNFGVVWGLSGRCFNDDDTLDSSITSTQVTVTDTGGTTNDLYRSDETPALTLAGTPTVGCAVMLAFQRVAANGSDTLAIDAGLLGVELYYNINANSDA